MSGNYEHLREVAANENSREFSAGPVDNPIDDLTKIFSATPVEHFSAFSASDVGAGHDFRPSDFEVDVVSSFDPAYLGKIKTATDCLLRNILKTAEPKKAIQAFYHDLGARKHDALRDESVSALVQVVSELAPVYGTVFVDSGPFGSLEDLKKVMAETDCKAKFVRASAEHDNLGVVSGQDCPITGLRVVSDEHLSKLIEESPKYAARVFNTGTEDYNQFANSILASNASPIRKVASLIFEAPRTFKRVQSRVAEKSSGFEDEYRTQTTMDKLAELQKEACIGAARNILNTIRSERSLTAEVITDALDRVGQKDWARVSDRQLRSEVFRILAEHGPVPIEASKLAESGQTIRMADIYAIFGGEPSDEKAIRSMIKLIPVQGITLMPDVPAEITPEYNQEEAPAEVVTLLSGINDTPEREKEIIAESGTGEIPYDTKVAKIAEKAVAGAAINLAKYVALADSIERNGVRSAIASVDIPDWAKVGDTELLIGALKRIANSGQLLKVPATKIAGGKELTESRLASAFGLTNPADFHILKQALAIDSEGARIGQNVRASVPEQEMRSEEVDPQVATLLASLDQTIDTDYVQSMTPEKSDFSMDKVELDPDKLEPFGF